MSHRRSFAGTELDSVENPQVHAGVGNRGWYAKEDAGFQFGLLHPSIDSNFVLISDTRVYVKRNTLTNLAKILVGEQEFTLTRVPQPAGTKLINDPSLAHGEPDIDYYTIGGSGPPSLMLGTTSALKQPRQGHLFQPV